MRGLEFLRSSLEHCHKDKLAEITERHQIEYSKGKRALQYKFERKYLLLHSKLKDKNKDLEKTETSPSRVKGLAPEGGGTGAGIEEQGRQ